MREILLASLTSSGGFLVSLLLGALAIKTLATLLGPAGIGLLSLLRQVQQTCVTVGTFGGQNTLAQGLASRREDPRLGPYGVSVAWIFIASALATSVALLVLAPQLAAIFPDDLRPHATGLVRWLVLPIVVGVAAVFYNGVLTAWRDVMGISLAQVADAVLICLLAWPAAVLVAGGRPAALVVMMALALSATVVVAWSRARKGGLLRDIGTSWGKGPQRADMREFFQVALGALVASIISTGALLAVRSLVAHRSSLAAAGLFDTAWSLSQLYVWLLLASLTTWYLPTLAHLESASERAALISRYLRFVALVMTPAVMGLAALKPLVIQVLYTDEFLPALELWRWLLLGDYLRASSWVLAMTAFARADMRAYLGAELAWHAGFLLATRVGLESSGGLERLGPAYVALHAIYLAGFVVYAHRRHAFRPSGQLLLHWFAGLALVTLASLACWHGVTGMDWGRAAVLCPLAIVAVLVLLTREERRALLAFAKGLGGRPRRGRGTAEEEGEASGT